MSLIIIHCPSTQKITLILLKIELEVKLQFSWFVSRIILLFGGVIFDSLKNMS